MDNKQLSDLRQKMWVQHKLHSLLTEGYRILHDHVEIAPSHFMTALVHDNGNRINLHMIHDTVKLYKNGKHIHTESFD